MLSILSASAWILLGLIYCNALEWVIHKKLLHEMAKKPKSFFKFHWQHHALVRRNEGRDPDYDHHSVTKEFFGIMLLALVHAPLMFVSPALYFAIATHGLYYLYVHRKSHKDLKWAKQKVPWHWDHHMGPRQSVDANWCVTSPFFDWVMHTRKPYYDTKKYHLDLARKSARTLNEKNIGNLEKFREQSP